MRLEIFFFRNFEYCFDITLILVLNNQTSLLKQKQLRIRKCENISTLLSQNITPVTTFSS
jgi:hypothetical protein